MLHSCRETQPKAVRLAHAWHVASSETSGRASRNAEFAVEPHRINQLLWLNLCKIQIQAMLNILEELSRVHGDTTMDLAKMDLAKPLNGETVWVEYPVGKRFRALYESAADAFVSGGGSIPAAAVATWSRQLHEPLDTSVSRKEFAVAT